MAFPIRVKASSNIDRWLRKFERDFGATRADVLKEPELQAKLGQQLGVALAPRDQNATLIHAIAWKVDTKDKASATAKIYVKPLVHPRWNRSRLTRGRADKYSAIHHLLGEGEYARGQARSGDPHWMFTVAKEIQRRYKTRMVGRLSRLTKR